MPFYSHTIRGSIPLRQAFIANAVASHGPALQGTRIPEWTHHNWLSQTPTECFTNRYTLLRHRAPCHSSSDTPPYPPAVLAESQETIMTNLRRSLHVVDVDTANRAEVLDDLAKSLESVKVSVTLILGHATSALECRAPPNACVSKTLAARGPGAAILELSLFDHNLRHVLIPDGLSYKDFGFTISEGVEGPCRLPVDLQARTALSREFLNLAKHSVLTGANPSPSDTPSPNGNPDDPSEPLLKVQALTQRLTDTVETPGPPAGIGVMIPSLLGNDAGLNSSPTLPTLSSVDHAPTPIMFPGLPHPPGGHISFPGGDIGLSAMPPIFVDLSQNPNNGDLLADATEMLLSMNEDGPYPYLPFARKFVKVTTPRETVDPTTFAGDVALMTQI